ncbi:MAG: hypothetical protein A2X99_07440 [Deltaproteobacteria bacterium GWB2_55_19]|nr:MAG: hypothetical protein A2X99_07440 [Deltaproteobacteria bacterium GWB2_55_19]
MPGVSEKKKDLFRFTKTQAQGEERIREAEASAPGWIRRVALKGASAWAGEEESVRSPCG